MASRRQSFNEFPWVDHRGIENEIRNIYLLPRGKRDCLTKRKEKKRFT